MSSLSQFWLLYLMISLVYQTRTTPAHQSNKDHAKEFKAVKTTRSGLWKYSKGLISSSPVLGCSQGQILHRITPSGYHKPHDLSTASPKGEEGLQSCDVNHHCKGFLKMPMCLHAGVDLGWCSELQQSFSEISEGRQ